MKLASWKEVQEEVCNCRESYDESDREKKVFDDKETCGGRFGKGNKRP